VGIEVTDLTDGSVFETVAAADPEQASDAIAATADAQPRLRETTVPERCEWLEAIADGIEERKERFVTTIVREAGKPVSSARSGVDSAIERFRRAVEEARAVTGEFREGTTDGHEGMRATVKPEPIGTVLCISPYNYRSRLPRCRSRRPSPPAAAPSASPRRTRPSARPLWPTSSPTSGSRTARSTASPVTGASSATPWPVTNGSTPSR